MNRRAEIYAIIVLCILIVAGALTDRMQDNSIVRLHNRVKALEVSCGE